MMLTVPALSPVESGEAALSAYEALAPAYDEFTAGYDHERWLQVLERLALDHGLTGRRSLDAACGTGKSFAPLVARGYEVTACDISPRMVRAAAARLADPRRAFVADMRRLPPLASFDLVTCLDDAVNYLLEPDDLEAALVSMGGVLRPGGMLLFDANTLHTYRTTFATDAVSESEGRLFCWRGESSADAEPGELHGATVEVFTRAHDGCWTRATSRHRQRHHTREAVEGALARAGLALRAVRGQSPGARLSPEADEERHTKLVFLAQRRKEALSWS
jgi:SAM-dependent methyltransferase